MLCLTLKNTESIKIGDAIVTIEVKKTDYQDPRRVYIDAPKNISITRIPRQIEAKRKINHGTL